MRLRPVALVPPWTCRPLDSSASGLRPLICLACHFQSGLTTARVLFPHNFPQKLYGSPVPFRMKSHLMMKFKNFLKHNFLLPIKPHLQSPPLFPTKLACVHRHTHRALDILPLPFPTTTTNFPARPTRPPLPFCKQYASPGSRHCSEPTPSEVLAMKKSIYFTYDCWGFCCLWCSGFSGTVCPFFVLFISHLSVSIIVGVSV